MRRTEYSCTRGEIDNRPALTTVFSRHAPDRLLAAQEAAFDIGTEYTLQAMQGDTFETGLLLKNAGIINQGRELPQLIVDSLK
ncbi:hypothetical protein MnTg03_01610 [bacterium MnTg03]|nr:hypothetical protein MnTg03_01610 [bacterium MnTg03]